MAVKDIGRDDLLVETSIQTNGDELTSRMQMWPAEIKYELAEPQDLVRSDCTEFIDYTVRWPTEKTYDILDVEGVKDHDWLDIQYTKGVEWEDPPVADPDDRPAELVMTVSGVETANEVEREKPCVVTYTPGDSDDHYYVTTAKEEDGRLLSRAPESTGEFVGMFGSRQEATLIEATETAFLWAVENDVPVYTGPDRVFRREDYSGSS